MEHVKFRSIINKIVLLSLCFLFIGFNACEDNISDVVITEESIQISSYLDKVENKELYSEFVNLIKLAGMYDLLNAYGIYTCFIPSNEAVLNYYAEKDLSLETMTEEEIIELVQGHIISGKIGSEPIETIKFPIGSISTPNMNEHFIRINTTAANRFIINDKSNVIRWDDKVHNGIIHTIDRVLEPPTSDVVAALDELPEFSIFYEALKLTAMIDSLYLTENKNYSYPGKIPDEKPSGSGLIETPQLCKYGYTIFMESNVTFGNENINSIDDLIDYAEDVYYRIFPLTKYNDEKQAEIKADYTHRENALNRFVSYHMMDRMQDVNEFITPTWADHFTPNTIIREYIEMMMPNSIIEIQTGNIVNKNMYDDPKETLASDIKILKNVGSVVNVMFHEITNILTYEGVENNVLNKRLRIDLNSMISEFATNKYRGDRGSGYPYFAIPANYFAPNSKVSFSEETQFQNLGRRAGGFYNMYGDELLFVKKYDVTIQTPPIPAGRWEIRFSYTPNILRGVAQIYLNGKPTDIPQDLRLHADDPRIGWVKDSDTPDNGVENDKMMRNRGYMKGPSTIRYPDGVILRDFKQSIRKIVSTINTEEAGPVIFRIKSVMDNPKTEYMIDFMEFVPSSYLPFEGRD